MGDSSPTPTAASAPTDTCRKRKGCAVHNSLYATLCKAVHGGLGWWQCNAKLGFVKVCDGVKGEERLTDWVVCRAVREVGSGWVGSGTGRNKTHTLRRAQIDGLVIVLSENNYLGGRWLGWRRRRRRRRPPTTHACMVNGRRPIPIRCREGGNAKTPHASKLMGE